MPDLGKYAFAVLAAYASSLSLIALLVLISLRQNRRAKALLRALQTKEDPSR